MFQAQYVASTDIALSDKVLYIMVAATITLKEKISKNGAITL